MPTICETCRVLLEFPKAWTVDILMVMHVVVHKSCNPQDFSGTDLVCEDLCMNCDIE